jgi:hypothetical protein
MKSILLSIAILFCLDLQAKDPELIHAHISECENNGNRTVLLREAHVNKLLELRIGAHLNCAVSSTSAIGFEWNHDTLNILIEEVQVQRDTIITPTDHGETISISETRSMTMCRCFYEVDLIFENVKRKPVAILINGLTFGQNYAGRTIMEVADIPNNEYSCEMYHSESKTYNPSYNYSGKWDFDGDGTSDSLLFIGNGGAHAYYYLRIVLSADQVRRDYPTVHLDMPYPSMNVALMDDSEYTINQLIIFDFDRDGADDIFLNFNNDFSYIPEEWKALGLTKKKTVLYFNNGLLKLKPQ